MAFSAAERRRAETIAARYPHAKSATLPLLHLVQERDGWVTPQGIEDVADFVGLTPAIVLGTCSFYTMFKTEPVGKHQIQLCRTLSCTMRGCEDLQETIERKLGIGPGEKTADGKFSFELVECLGACGNAPVMRMDNRFWNDLTVEKLERVIDACRDGRDPSGEDFSRG